MHGAIAAETSICAVAAALTAMECIVEQIDGGRSYLDTCPSGRRQSAFMITSSQLARPASHPTIETDKQAVGLSWKLTLYGTAFLVAPEFATKTKTKNQNALVFTTPTQDSSTASHEPKHELRAARRLSLSDASSR